MKCFKCATDVKMGETNHIVDYGESIIIVRHVPAFVCPDCGEVMYTATVAKDIEKIVNAAKEIMTEISVINYSSLKTA